MWRWRSGDEKLMQEKRVVFFTFHVLCVQRWLFYSFHADVFNLRCFDLCPGFGLPPSIQSHSHLKYVTQHRSMTATGQRKSAFHRDFT